MGADTKVTWQQCVKAAVITVAVVFVLALLYGWAADKSDMKLSTVPSGAICVVPT